MRYRTEDEARRRPRLPIAPKPASMSARVEDSGTGEMLFGAVANTVPEALLYEAFRSRLDNSNRAVSIALAPAVPVAVLMFAVSSIDPRITNDWPLSA